MPNFDLHGTTGQGWVGFDLDGTLAVYDGWKGIQHIGAPIKPMCELAKRLHENGIPVKIVTARVATLPVDDFDDFEGGPRLDYVEAKYARRAIEDWCRLNLGFVPEITNEKDKQMLWLVDDRAVQVEQNTGRIIGEAPWFF